MLPVKIDANETVVRLADEQVPVRAIARGTKLPADDVREAIHDAVATGRILRSPRDDWHPHAKGELPPATTAAQMDDGDLVTKCQRVYKVPPLAASFLALLMRRSEVPKEILHQRIEARRKNHKNDPTDPKMVDVIICKLRRQVGMSTDWALDIKTLWGAGYYMEPDMRKRAQKFINDYMEKLNGGPNSGRGADDGSVVSAGNGS